MGRSRPFRLVLLWSAGTIAAILSVATPARAQTEQVWPELSTFVKLNDSMRLYFLATTTREGKNSTEGEFGPNFDFYLKVRGKKTLGPLRLVRLDESRRQWIMVRVGYHYLPSYTGGTPESRGIVEATPRFPLPHGVLLESRNRMEFRFIGGEYSWRYRNRLTVDRDFVIGRLRWTPYVRAEVYYDSKSHRWSRTALIAGSVFPLGRHLELEGYYEHQNDTSSSPNRQVNAQGCVVNLYF
jgi:hypothetical protein